MNRELAKRVAREHLAKVNVLYAAVFLYDNSKRILRNWWEREVGDLLSKEYIHHMTLAFRPDIDYVMSLPLGSEIEMEVIGYGADEKGQAVKINAPISSTNKIPHITISTDGSSPVYSNQLLENELIEIKGPKIRGKVGYFDGSKVHYELQRQP